MLAFIPLVGLSVGCSYAVDGAVLMPSTGLFSCRRQGCSHAVDGAVPMLAFMLFKGLFVGF